MTRRKWWWEWFWEQRFLQWRLTTKFRPRATPYIMFVSLSSLPVSQYQCNDYRRLSWWSWRCRGWGSVSLDLGASSSSSSSSFYFPVFPPCSTPRDSTCFFSGLQGPTNHRYDLIGEGSGPCEKSRGSECRAGQRGAVVSGGWSYLASCGDSEPTWSTKTLGFVVGLILRGWNTIPSYVEGTFHTVSHEKRILFTNRWSVVFGCDTHQGFDSMEDFVETLTTRAKGGSILFRRMECFPKDFSKDIQKWS